MTGVVVSLVFRCEAIDGEPSTGRETSVLRWATRDEVAELADEAYAIRVLDALDATFPPAVRAAATHSLWTTACPQVGGAEWPGARSSSLSVFRFDDDALVTPHLARLVGHESPLLHLHRSGGEGMFARFAEHAEELWERGVPVSAAPPVKVP